MKLFKEAEMSNGVLILGVVAIVGVVVGLVAIVALALNRSLAVKGDQEGFDLVTNSTDDENRNNN